MEGMELNKIKELIIGKRVWIRKHPEYQFFKCIIKSAENDGCNVELDNGVKLKLAYSDLQDFKVITENDVKEFNFWCVKHKAMLKKAEKEYGAKPNGAINDVFNKAKEYLSDSQLNDVQEAFIAMSNKWETYKIDAYYEFVRELMK